MSDDWSLKNRVYYPTYRHSGELHFTEVDIEILRKKLIDDVKKESPDWYCVVDMINRRFGIHE